MYAGPAEVDLSQSLDVCSELLDPPATQAEPAPYDAKANALAGLVADDLERFAAEGEREAVAAGPTVR